MSSDDAPVSALRRELNAFFNGWVFLTRLPAPRWVTFDNDNLHRSARYFPLIGMIVGAAAAIVFLVADRFLPTAVAVLVSMLSSVWITGGFHEDGLADSADGFGGGYDKEKVLTIMKDSRLGSFGALALFFVLAGKFAALAHLAEASAFWLVLIAGHGLSRFAAVSFLYTDSYVQDSPSAKSKPMAEKISLNGLITAAVFGLAPVAGLMFAVNPVNVIVTLGGVALVRWWLARYFKDRIGGFTGDCLGAVQQMTEVTFYILLIAGA